jgi:predicted PurR-regulated permease PerM
VDQPDVGLPGCLGRVDDAQHFHKLEYFINARIVGGEIKAAAWEVLVALLVFETTFGVTGLILAPIIYAYAKKELVDRGLI